MELQVPATELRSLTTDPTTPPDWAGVVADLAHQLDRDTPGDGWYGAEVDRRFPGAGLSRYLEIRDRSCVTIGCRAPAHTADKITLSTTPTAAPPRRPTSGSPADMTIG
jgi:hypothetical protein